jgi:hypothetical protein
VTSPIVERAHALREADAIEAFLGELEAARIVAAAKLTSPRTAPVPPDDVLTLQRAAELCGASRRWVRDHAKELGGRQIGRKWVFGRRQLLGRR